MHWLCCCSGVERCQTDVDGTAPPYIEILRGRDGRDGRDGEPGPRGLQGRDGKVGPQGEKGDMGECSEHKIAWVVIDITHSAVGGAALQRDITPLQ